VITILSGLASAAYNLVQSEQLTAAIEANTQLLERITVDSRQPSAGPFIAENKDLRAHIADLEGQLAELGAPGYAPVPATPKSPAAELATSLQNPAARDQMAAQQAKAVAAIYGDLFKHFQFPPEQAGILQKLLLDKQMNQVDLGLRMMDPNLSQAERAQLADQLQAANAASDAKIRDFFSNDADFAYYQTYVQQQPERLEVSNFSTNLANANLTLDPGQSEALVNLMYQERSNFKFTQDFYDQSKLDPAAITGPAADTFLQEQEQLQTQIAQRAATLLTPEQLVVFKQNQATMRQMMQMNLSMGRQLSGSGQ
jgi:hypothetical protein